ncbi:MAG: hypothetical protein WBC74_04950 [Candidatus Omnitrophota bacterium]
MDLHHLHLENAKGLIHMAIFLVVLFKIHVIDRKLSLLEKTVTNK